MRLGASFGYLTGDGSPVANLADGPLSIYVVFSCDSFSALDYPICLDKSGKSATNEDVIYMGFTTSAQGRAAAGNSTPTLLFDQSANLFSAGATGVLSGHFTADGTTRTCRADASTNGDNSSGAGTVLPASMDRITIGRETYLLTPTDCSNDYTFFRVLIYGAAYSADVVDGL